MADSVNPHIRGEPFFCPRCGDRWIHQTNRQFDEASSGLNEIIRREGPKDLTIGDVDTYGLKLWIEKLSRDEVLLRWLEHKRPNQDVRAMQRKALLFADQIFEGAKHFPPIIGLAVDLFLAAKPYQDSEIADLAKQMYDLSRRLPIIKLAPGSGVYIVRALICMPDHGRREVDFDGPITITTVNGEIVLEAASKNDFWKWLNNGPGTTRNGEKF